MKKTRFNKDYCGEILIIGFTGNAEEIRKYLEKNFEVQSDPEGISSKKEKFNLRINEEVLAHVEVYPWTSRGDLE